jgi:luciferase family oxidoreductase group 1
VLPVVVSDLRNVPLSVLDLAPIPEGATAGDGLHATIDLARRAEQLGYRRFWVAEHHNMPGIASSAPPVLIGHLADATSSIHVGSGGVMLPNHVSLVVAEQFGMLEALHPGRIDLGIGRAPGTDQVTAAALRRSPEGLSPDDFPEQLGELIGFFSGEWPDGHPYAAITAVPAQGNSPSMWLLGSSGYSAQVAGLLGLPFAFAHHFSAENTLPALALYRQRFRPSATLAQPHAMVAAAVICADTDERAQWLAGPGALSFLRLRSGRPGRLPSPEEAAAYPYTSLDREIIASRRASNIIGSPETVRRGLTELLAATDADELMITTMVHDPADRLRSFELVADIAAQARAGGASGDTAGGASGDTAGGVPGSTEGAPDGTAEDAESVGAGATGPRSGR